MNAWHEAWKREGAYYWYTKSALLIVPVRMVSAPHSCIWFRPLDWHGINFSRSRNMTRFVPALASRKLPRRGRSNPSLHQRSLSYSTTFTARDTLSNPPHPRRFPYLVRHLLCWEYPFPSPIPFHNSVFVTLTLRGAPTARHTLSL